MVASRCSHETGCERNSSLSAELHGGIAVQFPDQHKAATFIMRQMLRNETGTRSSRTHPLHSAAGIGTVQVRALCPTGLQLLATKLMAECVTARPRFIRPRRHMFCICMQSDVTKENLLCRLLRLTR
jgi:hypothetical protein